MTTFDEKCYRFLMKVPRGKVTTYAEIAKAIGSRHASRAVGGAMNRNLNAPRVPCHRVVRSNGELGGYAGGLPAKVRLLEKEGIKIKKMRPKIRRDGDSGARKLTVRSGKARAVGRQRKQREVYKVENFSGRLHRFSRKQAQIK